MKQPKCPECGRDAYKDSENNELFCFDCWRFFQEQRCLRFARNVILGLIALVLTIGFIVGLLA